MRLKKNFPLMYLCLILFITSNSALLDVLFADNQNSIAPITIQIWPGMAPGETRLSSETILPPRDDGILRITNVVKPTLTVYRPDSVKNQRSAILICPGGGYRLLAMNLEGTEIAQWFNSIGMTAAILKYRVPNKQKGALQDAQRAMRMLRYNAHQWDFETDKIGIIGFSAGGHLAACTSTNHKKASYKNIDQIDNKSSRPNFVILVYPANLITRSGTLSRQCKTSKDTPRTILFQTQDDRVMVENSIYYYLALKRSHIPSELHIYPTGGHGYGLRSSSFGISEWPVICKKWLQKNGFLHIMHNR